MKKLIFIFVYFVFFINDVLAYNSIYDTNFYEINIDNEILSDAKKREINKIKKISLKYLLQNILPNQEFQKVTNIINNNQIDYLIKNIIINDEFISQKKYSAKVKINFHIPEIIDLFRINEINYSDIHSPKILLIVSENNQIFKEGLTKDNSFYKENKILDYGLLKFIYPQLTPNDRYILPYSEIINEDTSSFNQIASKYKTKYIILIKLTNLDEKKIFEVSYYSSSTNEITFINNLTVLSNINYTNQLFDLINNWWKNYSIIDNATLTNHYCIIKNNNIHELNYINSNINLLSQVESNTLSKISLGSNTNNINFYGDLSLLILKLSHKNIKLDFNKNNDCIISTTN